MIVAFRLIVRYGHETAPDDGGYSGGRDRTVSNRYRPFTLARAGELAGFARLDTSVRDVIDPVFRVPPRATDFDTGGFSKSLEDHLRPLPAKIADSWASGMAYLDLSLLDSETPIDGLHPFSYFAAEGSRLGITFVPLLTPGSTPEFRDAAIAAHRSGGIGIGILAPQDYWLSVDPDWLPGFIALLGLDENEVDLFVDYGRSEGALIEVAVMTELRALEPLGPFRSVTIGGEGFPDLTNVPRGTTEYPRKDWHIYRAVHRKLAAEGASTPEYFDHLILNTDSIELNVDPRFMSISAALRYTVSDQWLLAKGQLFKGQGGSGQGGAALIDPLIELTRHSEFATPMRSQADDWIESVAGGSGKPGGPQQWREWGTLRHVEVTAAQLASLT